MPTLVLDPMWEREVYRLRAAGGGDDRYDEVWDGLKVIPPMPGTEHQDVAAGLLFAFAAVVSDTNLGQVYPGVNVSDRGAGWGHNVRCPDVAVILGTNPAVDHGSHYEGGPDFAVEIISPGEDPYAKLGFYAKVNTREVLIVHRDPWAVELFTLRAGGLVLAGWSDLAAPTALPSTATGLTFRLVTGVDRPGVEVAHPPTGRVWLA